ncbi:MAG TPA: glucosamine-6-phosphate deaminase [Chthoniobacteraceae bacterium]|jgi:glucosamine-6-phosphate deaminase|nr:glucosamine-6-phosphate deaminase [Chthoniobacteraceae bacterium]
MEVIIQTDAGKAAEASARIVEDLLRKKPAAVLGLATGSTPSGLYRELIRMHREDGLDLSQVTSFNLDEYVGLPPEHPASYRRFMQENFFGQVNIPSARIHIPDGLTSDIPAFCQQYEAAIRKAGGIDLQILGLGHDGHIGFNEPTSSLASRTRIKTLTRGTIAANQRFFTDGEQVPQHVITMGVGTIMEARTCLLLAFGEAKAEAVAAMIEGPMTAMCPASVLQMHPQTVVMIDEPAARLLKRTEYYRYVYSNKPPFQQVAVFPVR